MGQNSSKGQDLTGLSTEENYFGLHNFGNTCYLNSVMQALYFCLPFRNAILNYYKKITVEEFESSNSMLLAVADAFYRIRTNQNQSGTFEPKHIVTRLQTQNELFQGQMHQDAHEFLNYLLNDISETLEKDKKEVKRNEKNEAKTFIHSIFEGFLTNETRCLCCENITSREESFLDLSIDIEQNTSVTHCLRTFSSVETLQGNDKFHCDVCRSLQEAEKRMRVKSIPQILIVHLKRFKYVEINHRFTLAKLSHRVVFPFDLKLPNTSNDCTDVDQLYELFAIVIHLGVGGNYGHYISLVKTRGCWVLFDDDRFKKVDPNALKAYFGSETEDTHNKTCGYLLFYQRCQT